MTITITGCTRNPKWETLQSIVREAVEDEAGRFTRIRRRDNGCNYAGLGQYEVTFIPDIGDAIEIALTVSE